MTRIFIEPTGRRIAPFDDPPGEVPIANRPLREWQEEMIHDAGLERVDAPQPPCLVVPDTLFTTGEVLRRLVDGAAGRNAVLALVDSQFGRGTTFVQPGVVAVEGGWRFDAVRFESGGDEPAEPVFVDPEERIFELPLIPGTQEPTKIPLPRHPVLTVHHWVHILWANQVAGAMLVRRIPRWKGILRLLWAFVRCWSFNRWRILGKLNTIGRRCDIHPTAVVEGCTLGDGVTVGPHARLLFSHIGDGATILPGAHVEACTIGARAVVAQMTTLRICVLYPESFAGQLVMQACVLGRRAFLTLASWSIDLNLEHDIRVPLDGELHSTGTRLLGSAFGHECRVGAGIFLASGRAIPNGAFVMRDPKGVIARVPTEAGDGPLVNAGGRLVPLDR